MDLISAKVEAAKQSREKKQRVYINVDSEGECSLSAKAGKETLTVYANGKWR